MGLLPFKREFLQLFGGTFCHKGTPSEQILNQHGIFDFLDPKNTPLRRSLFSIFCTKTGFAKNAQNREE
jgi:hypothetical protein